MKCAICGMLVSSMEEAMKETWVPLFLEGADEHGPSCESCAQELLSRGADGMFRLKEKFLGRIVYAGEEFREGLEEEIVLGFILN